MADLTLNEYADLSPDEIMVKLEEEVGNILPQNYGKADPDNLYASQHKPPLRNNYHLNRISDISRFIICLKRLSLKKY